MAEHCPGQRDNDVLDDTDRMEGVPMAQNRRWIQSMIATAETLDVRLPWARGARRAEWIARRNRGRCQPRALSA